MYVINCTVLVLNKYWGTLYICTLRYNGGYQLVTAVVTPVYLQTRKTPVYVFIVVNACIGIEKLC